jgi:hypothetical protein
MSKKTKMKDDEILSIVQRHEEDASAYTWGQLGTEREKAMREYYREPYGNEEEGHSEIVTSEVQDTVEWILPSLLKIFSSTDKAVCFEPTKAEDVDGAEQATSVCNYVFYKQNPGFLVLYTAFKDALLVKNGVVTWRKETKRTKTVKNVRGVDEMSLAMLIVTEGWDIEATEQLPPQPMAGPDGQPAIDPMTGQPMMGPSLINARLFKMEERKTIKVECIQPERLLVKRDWVSPLLAECPYVGQVMPVTLSELHEMGFDDVEADDLTASDETNLSPDAAYRQNRSNTAETGYIGESISTSTDDESQTQGILYREWVLVDADGDGVAERLEIYRLKDKILSQEECSHVPVAMFSPILNPHRFDGMSVAETMSDLQRLKTELTRQMMDSAYLANNARTVVQTDASGSPMVNIDDLLDSRAGGIIRARSLDSIRSEVVPFVGGQTLPLLEYVDSMGERRTGVSRAQQGLDANVLRNDKTAVEVQQTANAAQARVELIARVFAETGMKPMFQGLLKLFTDGEMEKIAFRLLDKFVEYDPNEWRDSYDMTINVGLGTGDRNQQMAMLQGMSQAQMAMMATPLGPMLLKPKQIYNVHSKMAEAAGYKNVGEFWTDPGEQPIPPQQPPPDPQLQIAQMKLQGEAQKMQAETKLSMEMEQMKAQAKLQETRGQLELQASNDARDADRAAMQAQFDAKLEQEKLKFDYYKTDQDNRTKIIIEEMRNNTARDTAALSAQTSERNAERSAQAAENAPEPAGAAE